MQYKLFGKTNEEVSRLGFGCMRFQTKNGYSRKIDEEIALKQVRYAIDNGVNYIDTAYNYHGGESEKLVAKVLKDGYREKVKLATKLPSWLIKSREDMDKYLNEQLEKLETDHIDFYLLHTLNKKFWNTLKENDVLDFLESIVKDGRVKHVGFSFHDELSLFKEIVDSYDWDFCQIQYNYLDENYQAGTEGLKYAKAKGMGVVIMEPLRGGNLSKKVPDDIKAIWDKADIKRSPAEWALKFIFNHPEVDVVLSGMNEMEHIEENIRIASETTPNSLTDKEIQLINNVKEEYKNKIKVGCTKCAYCMPCPKGVDIPACFSLYNESSMFDFDMAKLEYSKFVKKENKASACIECGQCEEKCPQHLNIREKLKEVEELFE
ncbi:aldo/keto reductase [Vallitalea longa]|uniref:Aldo/keto reductase n=1 Tax=Vallitalea longa TaxID=2936439 RepID=A0A9W5YDZ5_9FIRM|nr:aldo/keto reductase [Vallitalea longa]GKX31752.1 aldo/keto reductase [Vallitalea longa]